MKILITGISGFVGHHFLQYLYDENQKAEIIGVDLKEPSYDYKKYSRNLNICFYNIDLLDYDKIHDLLKETVPDYILHLASYSSVAYSWKNPTESFKNNTNIFLNLVTAVMDVSPKCRILSIGSSEEYGHILTEDIPIKERLKLNPVSPYAVARVSQELLSKIYVESYGLDIVLTRSFNHIGPWQDDRFVVPSFAKRILAIRNSGNSQGTIMTGDLSIIRDFVDVRDVVKAYWILLQKGKKGDIYNICSGNGVTLQNIVDLLADIIGVEVQTEVNPEFVRPNDNPIMIGENYKIYSEFGWKPQIELSKTLKDIVSEMQGKEIG